MADEVQGGQAFTYAAGFRTATAPYPTQALEIAGNVAQQVAGRMVANIEQAGDTSFVLSIVSPVNRARVADIKYDLDQATQMVCRALNAAYVSSNLVADTSSVPTGPGQPTGGGGAGAGNPNLPPPPGTQPSFIAGLAKSLGVSESNAWLILFGGIGAVVLMMKK